MLLIGVFTKNNITAVTGSVEQRDGEIEKEVIGLVADDVFVALAMALQESKVVKPGLELKIFTTDDNLLKFLTPPISVSPTVFTNVKGWGRVGWGGNPNQWQILYGLATFNRWQIRKVEKLTGAQELYDDYKSTVGSSGTGLSGGARRLYKGIWAAA